LLELVALDCPCFDEIRFPAPARFEAILDQVGVRTPQVDLVALSLDAIALVLTYEPRTWFVRVVGEDLVGSGHACFNRGPRNLVEWRWR
jgi:hypothetical protein